MVRHMNFSQLAGLPVLAGSGERVGKVTDAVVRLVDGSHPRVSGIVLRLMGRDVFLSLSDVAAVSDDGVRLASPRLDVRPFDRRSGEVLLRRDVVGRMVIDVERARLVRVRDVALQGEGTEWRVVGICAAVPWTPRAILPGVWGPRRGEEIPWSHVEPLVSHVPTAKRQLPLRRLAALRPADIADIVERASHDEGEEILSAVRADRELEADVFEELNEDKQIEFLEARSDGDAATVLSNMHPDDAADLLMKLDQERRLPILQHLPQDEQTKIRTLLGFSEETAGGLMSNDFVSVPETETVREALRQIRALPEEPHTLTTIYTLDDGRLSGSISLGRLLRSSLEASLRDVVEHDPIALYPDADIPSVAMEMAHYNLSALPIVDYDFRILGVITYDDLVEVLLPNEWRWRGRPERAVPRTVMEPGESAQ